MQVLGDAEPHVESDDVGECAAARPDAGSRASSRRRCLRRSRRPPRASGSPRGRERRRAGSRRSRASRARRSGSCRARRPTRAPRRRPRAPWRAPRHDLDERRDRHRVEEVQAEEPLGPRRAVAARSSIEIDDVFVASTAAEGIARSTRASASVFSVRGPRGRPRPRARSRRSAATSVRGGEARRRTRRACASVVPRSIARTTLSRTRSARGIRFGLVALDDDDLGSREQERVRDAGAHAAAAEHADAARRRSSARPLLEELGHAALLLGALEQHGLQLVVDRRMPSRGARSTRLVCWVASGSLRRDAVGDRVRGGEQLAGRVHARDQTRSRAPRRRRSTRPVSSSSLARASPTISGRRQVAPAAAMMPRPVSGLPIRSVGDPMRMSAAYASSAPPPSAYPSSGGDHRHRQLAHPDERGGVDAPQRVFRAALAQLGDVGARGERAARAGEDEGARVASSSAQSACSASIVAWSIALRFSGRLRVATTRSGRRSTRRGPSLIRCS